MSGWPADMPRRPFKGTIFVAAEVTRLKFSWNHCSFGASSRRLPLVAGFWAPSPFSAHLGAPALPGHAGRILTLPLIGTRQERGVYAASTFVSPQADCFAYVVCTLKRPEGRAPGQCADAPGHA